ncbi:restrictase [Bacillus thuringiensis serovar pulsiensis BGSC 4CC1]|nr:restrictase [Bacillus thuringiensis serovar pulsiensis BGSC 4CC1]
MGIPEDNVFRTVFHPEYDYSDFVGTYRPIMERLENREERLNYKFIPGILLRSYVEACIQDDPVVLVIDEINRGNCSAIFGDFFQLLDRNSMTGESQYSINVPLEISEFIKEQLLLEEDGEHLKLAFPSNFYIFATMNTSDQSVFPVDSAFIRRWSWRYQGINYEDAANFYIKIMEEYYSWEDFLRKINAKIYSITESEDKQLGNRFIMPFGNSAVIHTQSFVEKVLFYLWNEIYKHEDSSNEDYIFKYTNHINELEEEIEFTFSQLFGEDFEAILKGFMDYNEISIVDVDEEELEIEEGFTEGVLFGYQQKPEKEIPIDTILYFSSYDIKAIGLYKGKAEEKRKKHTLLVQKGSQMVLNVKKGMQEGNYKIRERLIAEGVVERREDCYEFVRDTLFDTPSEAAGVIGGTRLTGTTVWKSEDGRNLNELMGKKK